MRKLVFFFCISTIFFSCTSNTILEKPKDLIPKDTMNLIFQDLFIASSATFFNNKNLQKNINYMPLVYDKYKIDSSRFKRSNLYYMSKIDDYQKIMAKVNDGLQVKKEKLQKEKAIIDSIRKDSIRNLKERNYDKIKDSIKIDNKFDLDTTVLEIDAPKNLSNQDNSHKLF